ncbi:alpha/beta hydrolase [Pyruvatibacter sp.]|uniref:alpha/beta fold hydrolase n=1 Tax=Pyruvatibacter sp. TaxID=1981328 RepID=UPI0032EAE8A3
MITGTHTRMISANGLEFEVAVGEPLPSNDADSGTRPRKLALLLHGFPELNFSWRLQIPLLQKLGYTVWAPNLRGYGNTSRPDGVAAYAMDCLVDDVAGLVDAAKAQGIADEICLMAHDWGGAIAWTFMLGKVRPIDRFVVMNLPHPTRFLEEFRTWKQFKRSWYVIFFQIPWLPEKLLGANRADAIGKAFYNMAIDKSRFPDDVLDVYRDAASKPGALTAMVNYYRAAMRRPSRFKGVIDTPPVIETPTLMVWGEEDSALCIETTDRMDPLMADFTLRRLPNVSHWVQQEAPEQVNAILEAWLGGHAVPHAGQAPLIAASKEAVTSSAAR